MDRLKPAIGSFCAKMLSANGQLVDYLMLSYNSSRYSSGWLLSVFHETTNVFTLIITFLMLYHIENEDKLMSALLFYLLTILEWMLEWNARISDAYRLEL